MGNCWNVEVETGNFIILAHVPHLSNMGIKLHAVAL